jgi:selenocysteine-specific elongation factor
VIVGTAGHVDHGKTALVRCLTGVDTDRLPEEKARGLSIDLGFAYLPLREDTAPPVAEPDDAPDGAPDGAIGFVDVPGHERFVRTMLAGAAGIDFVLLVVAADDGVMPQTREHLAILDLLGIGRGLVALTKTDLVSAARPRAAEAEIRDALAGTRLAGIEVIPVSAVTGEGVAELRQRLLREASAGGEPRPAGGRFRLAVDRSFALPGIGTIVTGTVLSGIVAVGDRVLVSPSGLAARVRSIHAQNRAAKTGHAGERCALNLAGEGVSRDAIRRGDTVLDPALHLPSSRIDAELRLLPGAPSPIGSRLPVRLHHLACEVGAHVMALQEPIAPGATGWVQLVLERPIAASVGDPFVLRDAAARHNLAGGHFVELHAAARRRRSPERLARLKAAAKRDPAAALSGLSAIMPGMVDLAAFARDRTLDEATVIELGGRLGLHRIGGFALSAQHRADLTSAIRCGLERWHAENPERAGVMPVRLRLATRPVLPEPEFAALLAEMIRGGEVAGGSGAVRLAQHRPRLAVPAEALLRRIRPLLGGKARFRPPRVRDLAALLRIPEPAVRHVLHLAASMGHLEEVAHDHFFLPETMAEIVAIVQAIGGSARGGLFAAADLRDRLDNGRKVAIQILEYLDRRGITLRRGDCRQLASPTPTPHAGADAA